jgi:hypothetical protein
MTGLEGHTMTAIDPATVRNMPAETQRQLLDALLTELGAHGVMQFAGPTGMEYVYRAPPNAKERAEQSLREATEAELLESIRLAEEAEDFEGEEWMSMGEVLRLGDRMVPPPASPEPSAPSAEAVAR